MTCSRRFFEQLIDGANQRMPVRAQFADAVPRYLFQDALSAWQQRHQHAAPVVAPARAPRVAVRFQAVDQFDDTVMFQCQPIRQGTYRCFFAGRQPSNGQQQKVLLRLQARYSSVVISAAMPLVYRTAIY